MAPFSLARNTANLVESFHIQRHRRGFWLVRVRDELLNFRPCLNQLLVSIVQVQHTGNGEFERIILRAQLATGLVVATSTGVTTVMLVILFSFISLSVCNQYVATNTRIAS